ncbi:MAG: prephenate dehydrogenase [Bacillota bacterium]|jgi:prephenate dehydrogenase
MITENTKFIIIGLGLIGGSYAKALTKHGYEVYAVDTDQITIEFAKAQGIVADGATDVDTAVKKGFFEKADMAVFALYPNAMLEWLEKYQQYFKSGIVITDVSGVKTNIVDKAQSLLRADLEFVGSHPMAGKESSGIAGSDDSIFQVANFIITPTEKNTVTAVNQVRQLGRILGFHTISDLDIQTHDETIGFLSQLTHAIAVSLMTCNDSGHLEKYTGDSFRDLTRIAKINERLWPELFFLNKDILVKHIDAFSAELQKLKGYVEKEDEEALKEMFIKSTARRKAFDR